MEVEISGGHTAQLRDRLNVRGKKRLRSQSATTFVVLRDKFDGNPEALKDAKPEDIKADGELMDALDDFGGAALLAFVESWTLEALLPTTREEWLDFDDPDVYDKLVLVVTPLAYDALNNGTVVVTPDTVKDPDSPTGPSSD